MSKLQMPMIVAAIAMAMVSLTGSSRVARADTSGTFATFSAASGSSFDFMNGTGSFESGTGSLATAGPITFQFLTANSSGFGTTPFSALVTVTSSASGAGSSGALTDQGMGTTTFTFTTTGGSPTTLLTVTSTNASIYGLTGGRTATLADSSLGSNIISYSSPFLTFGATGKNSYALSLVGLSSQLGLGGNSLLSGFHSSGTGAFSAAPVPEASTLISFGLLILGGGIFLMRQRKQTVRNDA